MSQPLSILIVDDTADLRESLCEFLSMEGYNVSTASNGEQALKLLMAGTATDLIITDVVMPVMDGIELVRTLRQHQSLQSIPVIIFSARPQNDPQIQEQQGQAVRFVNKPGSLDSLLSSIQELTGA